jgi:hypothetical protein
MFKILSKNQEEALLLREKYHVFSFFKNCVKIIILPIKLMIFRNYNIFQKKFKFLLFFAFFYQISKIKKIIFSKKFLNV